MFKILLVEDDAKRFKNFSNALINKDIKAYEKSCFIDSNIYYSNNENKFCKKVKKFADNKKIIDLYFYLFKIIEDEQIDIIFIDLFLSDNDNDNQITTGEKLIKKIRSNILHKNIPIVLHSRGKDKTEDLSNRNILKGNTYFIPTKIVINNPKQLRDKIFEKIDNTKITVNIEEYRKKKFHYNIAFLCALKKELNAIKQFIKIEEEKTKKVKIAECGNSPCQYGYFIDKKKGIILKVLLKYMKENDSIFGNYGERITSKVANDIIKNCKPEYIAMTGVMAGYKYKVKLGDIIVAKHTFVKNDERSGKGDFEIPDDHRSYSKCFDKHIDTLKTLYQDDSILSQAFDFFIKNYQGEDDKLNEAVNKLLKRKKDTKVKQNDLKKFFQETLKILENKSKRNSKYTVNSKRFSINTGSVLTRNRVLDNQDEFDKIVQKKNSIIGLEMEIDALYRVAENSKNTKAIALKTVVDYADGKKNKAWHTVGSYLSAKIMLTLFLEIVYPSIMQDNMEN